MRLWVRLTLAATFVALVPVLVLGWLSVRTVRASVDSKPLEDLGRNASGLATFVDAWAAAATAQADGWSRVWSLASLEPEHRTGLLRAVWLATEDAITVGLYDAGGAPLVAPVWLGPSDVPAGRVAGSPARADALAGRLPELPEGASVVLGPPYRDAEGQPAVVVRARAAGADATLAVELSLGRVAAAFSRIGGAGLAGADGHLVVGQGDPLLGRAEVQDVLGVATDLTFSSSDVGAVRGAVSGVPGIGWSVVVAEAVEEGDAAASAITAHVQLVGVLVVAVGVALGLVLQQLITAPVGTLREAVGAIADGELSRRLRWARRDELGELAGAFDELARRLEHDAARISAQQHEIETFNRELQDRVEERGRQLAAAQEGLVRASQMAAIAEIGAGLAHELNNPLAAILGLVQLLQARGAGDPAALAQVEAQALRCRDVVATMTRFAAGEVDVRAVGHLDLRPLVQEAVASASAGYAQRGVALAWDGEERPLEARVEPLLASQILGRWLAALRAGAAAGAALTVRARRDDGRVGVQFVLSGAVSDGDDARAAALQRWVGRRLVELAGGVVDETSDGRGPWTLWLPGGRA